LDFALLHDKIGVALGETRTFEERLYFVLRRALVLQKELILFQTNGSTQDDFVGIFVLKAVIGIVEDNLNKRVHCC
jgi:hypothetical protein